MNPPPFLFIVIGIVCLFAIALTIGVLRGLRRMHRMRREDDDMRQHIKDYNGKRGTE